MDNDEMLQAAAERLEAARVEFAEGGRGSGLRLAEALERFVMEGGRYDEREGEIAPCLFCGDPHPAALPCLTCARAGL